MRLEAFDKVLLCEPMFGIVRPNSNFEANTHVPGACRRVACPFVPWQLLLWSALVWHIAYP
jgi:hypothetical protein